MAQEYAAAVMAALVDSKLISTGNEKLDFGTTWIFICFSVYLVLVVGLIFWYAYRDARNEGRLSVPRRKPIFLFLALAIVSLFVVNAIKFQYERCKLATWKDIDRHYVRVQKFFNLEGAMSKVQIYLKDTTWKQLRNFGSRRYLHPDAWWESARGQIEYRINKLFEKLTGGGSITQSGRETLESSYQAFNWRKRTDGIWDYFKILVATPQRFYWTQQWFTGYTAWTFFVAVECYHREIPLIATFAFPLLGYIFGLAGAQCLFYVLLLLKPRVPRLATWFPRRSCSLIPFAIEVSSLWLFRSVWYAWYSNEIGWFFNMLQAVVIVLPPLSQIFVARWPHIYMRHQGTVHTAKRSMHWTYFFMSICMSGLLTCLSAWDMGQVGGSNFDYPKDITWRREERKNIPGLVGTIGSLINSLGDHDWVSAEAFDVLFSVVALSSGAVVDNLDARSMVKAGVWPWIDDGSTSPAKRKSRKASRSRSRSRAGMEIEHDEVASSTSSRARASRSRTRARRVSQPPMKRDLSRGRTRSLSRALPRSGPESEHDDDDVQTFKREPGGAEAAAMALGLFTLLGLGVASTAVYGAGGL